MLVTSVISTSVASSPISAASAGDAIIGDATVCSMMPRNRSGDCLSKPVARQMTPTSKGTTSVDHAVAASTMPGRRM